MLPKWSHPNKNSWASDVNKQDQARKGHQAWQSLEQERPWLGIRTIPCIFVEEKNQEALICFISAFMCKNVFGREGKCVENVQAESRTQENLFFFSFSFFFFFLVWRCLGPFVAPSTLYEVAHLVRPPPVKLLKWFWSWHPWKDLDFQFLKSYTTQKSNSLIKSYGSEKLVVHRSMC